MKRWRILAAVWPPLCLAFEGIILAQAFRGVEGRWSDALFAAFPLVFFAIGMAMRRRLLTERRYATVRTTAVVVSRGRRTQGGKRMFFPEYEFQADGRTCRAVSPRGYGACFVAEGRQVPLYYMPGHPELFYVPAMRRRDLRLSALLVGLGVLWPLLGLFAPLLRRIFACLY